MTMPARDVLSDVPDLTGVSLEELETVATAPVVDRFGGDQIQIPDERQSQQDATLTQD